MSREGLYVWHDSPSTKRKKPSITRYYKDVVSGEVAKLEGYKPGITRIETKVWNKKRSRTGEERGYKVRTTRAEFEKNQPPKPYFGLCGQFGGLNYRNHKRKGFNFALHPASLYHHTA